MPQDPHSLNDKLTLLFDLRQDRRICSHFQHVMMLQFSVASNVVMTNCILTIISTGGVIVLYRIYINISELCLGFHLAIPTRLHQVDLGNFYTSCFFLKLRH